MTAPTISFRGSAAIDGVALFADLSFDVVAGGWTCLLGPSGVGKTTLLRLIAGLETGSDFNGLIKASDRAPISPRVALMAQTDQLMPWLDVMGNVTLGACLRGEVPDLDHVHMLTDRLGLTPHLGKRPAQLSGGQRQRVALARTLMEDRPIVLLDEPFSALDAKLRAEMQELFAEALEYKTVFLVTHDPAEAARLGHAIQVLHPNGLTQPDMPTTPPIRAIDATETLRCQANLLHLLRTLA
ncbi:ABC transporter ATP-binding protein [Actibacterium sp. 188UL27-1]|uniref:ABC transporter ATP-binding protein n=1 Tax=Actibacterium sp. 188UL27-1 TaxID=2786961 RepID=UPI00351BFA22